MSKRVSNRKKNQRIAYALVRDHDEVIAAVTLLPITISAHDVQRVLHEARRLRARVWAQPLAGLQPRTPCAFAIAFGIDSPFWSVSFIRKRVGSTGTKNKEAFGADTDRARSACSTSLSVLYCVRVSSGRAGATRRNRAQLLLSSFAHTVSCHSGSPSSRPCNSSKSSLKRAGRGYT